MRAPRRKLLACSIVTALFLLTVPFIIHFPKLEIARAFTGGNIYPGQLVVSSHASVTTSYAASITTANSYVTLDKGHEAYVYLTYIIDNYSNLPSRMVFMHGHQQHKHGTRDCDGIEYDNLEPIKAVRVEFVQRTGYANFRCRTTPGCPAEIQPFRQDGEGDKLRPQEKAMAVAWVELFENDDVPHIIATPCCAQFVVSRAQVLKRPKREYEKFLSWLHNTPLSGFTSGRMLRNFGM